MLSRGLNGGLAAGQTGRMTVGRKINLTLRQRDARHRKYKRLELGGGEAY
jgi:hypothetical protein